MLFDYYLWSNSENVENKINKFTVNQNPTETNAKFKERWLLKQQELIKQGYDIVSAYPGDFDTEFIIEYRELNKND